MSERKDGTEEIELGTPEKDSSEGAGLAPEGWSETTPGGTGAIDQSQAQKSANQAGAELAMAAQAARLSETGALGFVGVEGMGSVIEVIQKAFSAVLSKQQGGAEGEGEGGALDALEASKIAEELRKEESVRLLLNEPARMRESDGQYDTLEAVLADIAALGRGESTIGKKDSLEVEDIYNLFGLGGPDLDPYQSTSTFLTVEDSEVRENIISEHLSEEVLGCLGHLVYFGGLGKSHLSKGLQQEWYAIAESEEKVAARTKVETKIGSECIRNDLYLLDVNTLEGSRPTMNGLSLSSVNHSVGVQNVDVPLYGTGDGIADLDPAASPSLDLSHLKGMVPKRFSQQGSNLSSAQALAALNTCISLDPDANDDSIGKDVIGSALQKFLPNTERERILHDSSTSFGGPNRVDAKVLRSELIKSSEVLQLLQERREANLHHFSLNDMREIKVTISEIAFNDETSFKKVWFETGLLDSEDDFRSVSSSIKISGAKGSHKTEYLDILYNLCESSGSIYKSCQKIVEGEVRDILSMKIGAKDASDNATFVGTCNLKLLGSTEQDVQKLDILTESGLPIGKLRVRVEANAALDAVRKFNANSVQSYKVFLYGGLQRKQKSKQLIPSNRVQVYDAAMNDLSVCECSGDEPSPTACHASAVVGDLMIVHGGLTNGPKSENKPEHGVHVLNMSTSTWYALENDSDGAPGARFDHTATVLLTDKENLSSVDVVFFGGEKDESTLSNTVSILEISNTRAPGSDKPFECQWQRATISGTIPKPRAGHASASVADEGKESLYVFGGRVLDINLNTGNGMSLSNELICGTLTTATDQNGQRKKNFHWEAVSVEGGSPPAREKCTMNSIGTKLLMSHGWIGEGKLPWINDLWLFDTTSRIWKRIMLGNAAQFPTSRYGIGSFIRYSATPEASIDLYTCDDDDTLSKCKQDEGMEVTAGATKKFLLHSLDSRGEPCTKPGKAYTVLVRKKTDDSSSVHIVGYPKVTQLPHSSSLFSFDFKSVVAGDYDLEVFSSCQSDPVSVARVTVTPDEPCPDCFVVSGPATVSCIAGEAAILSIAMHDKYGNSIGDVTDDDVKEIKALVKFKRESTTTVKLDKAEDNEVKASFVLQEKGTYNLYIFYGGIIATSMDIKCLAGGISLPKTHLDPASAKNTTWHSGVEYKFSVVLCDKNGIKIRAQDVQGSETMLKAFAEEYTEGDKGGSHVMNCAAAINTDGTLGFRFTPTRSGDCVVNVHYFMGEYKPCAIEGCPFMVKVASSEIEPAKSKLVKDPPSTLVAGDLCTLLVQAKDKYGNSVSTSHEEVRCKVETQQSKRVAKKINGKNLQDGTYEIKLQLGDAGAYKLHFEMMKEGQPMSIMGSPYSLKVEPAHINPRNCTAFGRGIQGTTPAGEAVSFLIVSRDPFGNRITTSGSSVEARIQSGVSIPCSITDNGDGTYTCSYVPGTEEEFQGRTVYSVGVFVNGEEVEESPFFQRVYPPQTSAYNTVALGVPKRMNSGESIEFVIQARDVEGRDSVHGMDPFILDLEVEEKQSKNKDKPSLTGEIKDLHNGKYLVKLFAEENLYAVASVGILLGTLSDPVQDHIKDSPFELMITPKGLFGMGLWGAKPSAATASVDESLAAAFMVSGRGLRECIAGEESEFDLMPVQGDSLAFNKTIKPHQIDPSLFSVELRGPQYITGIVEGPSKEGNFQARYRPFVAGAYVLVVKIGRFVLQQCPFSVKCVPDVTCAETCEIHDQGILNKRARQDLVLKFVSLDAQRNKNYSNDETFHVICRGGSIQGKGKMAKFQKHVVEADSKPLGEGIHQAVFRVPIEGAYSVIVLHQDRQTGALNELEASPVPFVVDKALPVPGDENADHSAAAVSMKNLTQKALTDSGSSEERKPNFLERRLKKILSKKDVVPEDHILQKDKPQPMFSAGLWQKPDHWQKLGIYTIGHPLRRIQYELMELKKRGLEKQ